MTFYYTSKVAITGLIKVEVRRTDTIPEAESNTLFYHRREVLNEIAISTLLILRKPGIRTAKAA